MRYRIYFTNPLNGDVIDYRDYKSYSHMAKGFGIKRSDVKDYYENNLSMDEMMLHVLRFTDIHILQAKHKRRVRVLFKKK